MMGKKITRRNWTHLPMPIEVIERVNKIGVAQGQPKLLTFQDRHGYENSDPDPYFQPLDHEIEGVVDDEPIKENVADDHEDINNNPADQGEEDQGEEVNEVDDPPKIKMKYRLQPMKQRPKNCLMNWQHKPYLRRQKNQNFVQDKSQYQ